MITYIYANSQIIAQHNGSVAQSNKHFYLHDRLSSVRQIIDSNGSVVKYYTYEPFGQLLESGGTLINPFKFSGQFFDDEIDEYHLRARQYDPYISRFTNRDAVDGKFENPLTLHKYLYCTNDPINLVDPQGLWEIETHRSFGRFGYGPRNVVISGGSSDPTDTPLIVDVSAPFDYGRLDIDFPPRTFIPPSVEFVGMHFMSRKDLYKSLIVNVQQGDPRGFEYLMHSWQDSYVHYDRFGKNYWEHVGTTADDPRDSWNVEHNCYNRTNLTTLIWEDIYIKNNMADAISEGWLPDDYTPLSPWMSVSEEIINY